MTYQVAVLEPTYYYTSADSEEEACAKVKRDLKLSPSVVVTAKKYNLDTMRFDSTISQRDTQRLK